MNTKTLGESYEGCLSRDWEKLLTILEGGGIRAHIYVEPFMDITAERLSTSNATLLGPNLMNYKVMNYVGLYSRNKALEVLEKGCVGWFPTKEDMK